MRAAASWIARGKPSRRAQTAAMVSRWVTSASARSPPEACARSMNSEIAVSSSSVPSAYSRSAVRVQQLAARHDEVQRRSGARQPCDRRGSLGKELLEVVQHDQRPGPGQPCGERIQEVPLPGLLNLEHASNLHQDESWIGEGSKANEPGPGGIRVGELGGHLHREAGPANPARTGQGHEAHIGASQQVGELGELGLATQEWGWLGWEVAEGSAPASLEHVDERVHILAPASVLQLHRVAVREGSDRGRQVGLGGHLGATHEHGDHANRGGKGRLDLLAYEVCRLVKPPGAGGRRCIQPPQADHNKNCIRARDRTPNLGGEVTSGLDRVHVDEHRALPEPVQ